MLSRRIDWVVCHGVVGVDNLMTDGFLTFLALLRGEHILDLLSTLPTLIAGTWARNIRRLEILWGFVIFWDIIVHFLIIWAWRYWVVSSHLFHHFSMILDDFRLCDTFQIWFIGRGFERSIFCLLAFPM